jgi:hypothetical protein
MFAAPEVVSLVVHIINADGIGKRGFLRANPSGMAREAILR